MLTAWESLDFYTQLSMPVLLSTADRHARMDTVLQTMGLPHVKNTKARCGAMHAGYLLQRTACHLLAIVLVWLSKAGNT